MEMVLKKQIVEFKVNLQGNYKSIFFKEWIMGPGVEQAMGWIKDLVPPLHGAE